MATSTNNYRWNTFEKNVKTNYSPVSRNLYNCIFTSSQFKDDDIEVQKKIIHLFLDECFDEVTSSICNSVIDHFKKIAQHRNDFLKRYLENEDCNLLLTREHFNCDPLAKKLQLLCTDNRDMDFHQFCAINQELNSSKVEDYMDKIFLQNYNHDEEIIWLYRKLFLHQFVAAVMHDSKSFQYFSTTINAKIVCPLCVNQTIKSEDQIKLYGKYPTITHHLLEGVETNRCDQRCSCACFCDEIMLNTFPPCVKSSEQFKSWWGSVHDALNSTESPLTFEDHLLVGQSLCDEFEMELGSNSFNILHHMILSCHRLSASYEIMSSSLMHENKKLKDPMLQIEVDPLTKLPMWSNFMYDLPTSHILQKYESPEIFREALESDLTVDPKLYEKYKYVYTGKYNSIFNAQTKLCRYDSAEIRDKNINFCDSEALPLSQDNLKETVRITNKSVNSISNASNETNSTVAAVNNDVVEEADVAIGTHTKNDDKAEEADVAVGNNTKSDSCTSLSSQKKRGIHTSPESSYTPSSKKSRTKVNNPKALCEIEDKSNSATRNIKGRDEAVTLKDNNKQNVNHSLPKKMRNTKYKPTFHQYGPAGTKSLSNYPTRTRSHWNTNNERHEHFSGRPDHEHKRNEYFPRDHGHRRESFCNDSFSREYYERDRYSSHHGYDPMLCRDHYNHHTDAGNRRRYSDDDYGHYKIPPREHRLDDRNRMSNSDLSIIHDKDLCTNPCTSKDNMERSSLKSSQSNDNNSKASKHKKKSNDDHKPSSSQSKSKRNKKHSSTSKICSQLLVKNQVDIFKQMAGKYGREDKTDLLKDISSINMLQKQRDTVLIKYAQQYNILGAEDNFIKFKIYIANSSDDVIHCGQVNRAIGLNSKQVFLWKASFGHAETDCTKLDDYEYASVQFIAVFTLNELRSMKRKVDVNNPYTYVMASNIPTKSNNIDVFRLKLKQPRLYCCSCCQTSDTSNNIVSSNDLIIANQLNQVYHSFAESLYQSLCANKHLIACDTQTETNNKEANSNPKSSCKICKVPIRDEAKCVQSTCKKKFPNNPLSTTVDFVTNCICSKCLCDSIQSFKFFERNAHLMHCLNSTILYSIHVWGEIEYIDLSKCWTKYFGGVTEELQNDLTFKKMIKKTLSYRTIDLTNMPWSNHMTKKKYNLMKKGLYGSSLYNDNDLKKHMEKSLVAPSDVHFGVIKLPFEDFVFMCNSNFKSIDSVLISLIETQNIQKLLLSGRSGSAGGIVSTITNSHSMTKFTSNVDNVFVPSIDGTGYSCVYNNKDDVEKTYRSFYNDVYMNRLDISGKTADVSRSIAYARIFVAEMKTRTECLIIAAELGLLSDEEINESFLFVKMKDKDYGKNILSIPRFEESCLFTRYEYLLLLQACTTGEMRNHQALKAHVDGNKSHLLESLSLFGRIDIEHVKSQKNFHEVVKHMTEGYIFLPLNGISLKIPCCTVSVHCKLKQTVHIPDLSRNKYNWSRVHGPSGSWVVNESTSSVAEREWFEKNVSSTLLQ